MSNVKLIVQKYNITNILHVFVTDTKLFRQMLGVHEESARYRNRIVRLDVRVPRQPDHDDLRSRHAQRGHGRHASAVPLLPFLDVKQDWIHTLLQGKSGMFYFFRL